MSLQRTLIRGRVCSSSTVSVVRSTMEYSHHSTVHATVKDSKLDSTLSKSPNQISSSLKRQSNHVAAVASRYFAIQTICPEEDRVNLTVVNVVTRQQQHHPSVVLSWTNRPGRVYRVVAVRVVLNRPLKSRPLKKNWSWRCWGFTPIVTRFPRAKWPVCRNWTFVYRASSTTVSSRRWVSSWLFWSLRAS